MNFVVAGRRNGSVIQCLHNNPNRRDFRRVSPTSVQGVHQEKSPEPWPRQAALNRPACQEGGRNQRVPRKSFADDVRESVGADTISGKGVSSREWTRGPSTRTKWRGDFPPCVLAPWCESIHRFQERPNERRSGRAGRAAGARRFGRPLHSASALARSASLRSRGGPNRGRSRRDSVVLHIDSCSRPAQ